MSRSPIEIAIDLACGYDGRTKPARKTEPPPVTICPHCARVWIIAWGCVPQGATVRVRSCKKCDPEGLDEVSFHRDDGTEVGP